MAGDPRAVLQRAVSSGLLPPRIGGAGQAHPVREEPAPRPHRLGPPAVMLFPQPAAKRPLCKFFANIVQSLAGRGLAGPLVPFTASQNLSVGPAPVGLLASAPP